MGYNTTLVYQRYTMPDSFHSLFNKITNFLDKRKERDRNVIQMGLNDLEDYSLLYSTTNCEVTLWGHNFF